MTIIFPWPILSESFPIGTAKMTETVLYNMNTSGIKEWEMPVSEVFTSKRASVEFPSEKTNTIIKKQ